MMSEVPVDVTRMTDTFGDDYAFLNEIYTLYLDDSEARIQALTDIVASQDPVQCADIAHAIKGSSANVGAERMWQIAAAIEKNARASDLSDAQALMESITTEFSRVKSFILEYLDSIKS